MAASSLALPSTHSITLGQDVLDRLTAGVVCMTGITVRQERGVWQETEAVAAKLAESHGGKLPHEILELKEARDLYKDFSMDPSRHRPSSEALLRRVLKGQGLYRLNNVVDCCNLASLRFLLPIGLYDLAKIEGDITIRIGRDGEEYAGIRKGPVHLAGRLGLFDDLGPFGSPTSDSGRTSVGDATTDVMAVLMATAAYDPGRMQEHCSLLGILYARHCGGVVTATGVLGGFS